MSKSVLLTVQVLSEIAEYTQRGGEVDQETPRNKNNKAKEYN